MSGKRNIVPKKVFESWFALWHEGRRAGHDWLFWEPHGDRTAWFERQVKLALPGRAAVERRVQARFRLKDWPDLVWCRFREGENVVELVAEGEKAGPGVRVLPPSGDMVPRHLVDLVAASAPNAPGEVARLSLLYEEEARVVPDHALVSKGPASVEIGPERFETTCYTLEREGRVLSTRWVDVNRRIRKIEYGDGGLAATLTTKADALAAEGAGAGP